jgi:dehydrogenase/reductase SDR family protein 4
MDSTLKGKVAIVTGASKGIGEAIAHRLALSGARVVINSRKQDELDKVAEQITRLGGECLSIAGNTGETKAMKAIVDKTVSHFGGIDVIVNNAAANPAFGPVVETEEWAYDKIMDVNVKAPFELCKLAYPHMKQRGGGSVINMSSIAGERPDRGLGIYSVSKAALNMLTKVMAREWARDNIRVNAICPGLIKTKFSQALWENEEVYKKFMKMVPMGRMGTVEEIASLAYFLASDGSAYCTGTLFFADGGTTI